MPFSVLLLLASLPAAGYDQSVQNFNQWFAYWGDHPIGQSRWALHFDAHVRRSAFTTTQQWLLRPGLDYQLGRNIQLQSAYTWLPTYRYGGAPVNPQTEHRWWQQVTITTRRGRIAWTNRTRFEHRWLSRRYVNGATGPANRVFEQRLRHTVRATLPVGRTWTWSLGNEVFFPFPPENHVAVIDQHRIQTSFGKRVNANIRLEFFYMYQNIWQRNGRIREDNHTTGIAFYNTAPLWNIFKTKR